MKAEIRIRTFQKEFTQKQKGILKKYLDVLREHDLSIKLVVKQKKKMIIGVKKVSDWDLTDLV